MANSQCKECGCICTKCSVDNDVHLHAEIEHLKQKLIEKDNHIVTMETNFLNEANKYPNGELLALHEELLTWQDKYKRLYDAHRRVQRVNQGLEDKLLRLVDISETDKSTLTKDIATLSHKLAEANYTIKKLTEDNEHYKNDVSLAIQFLQCKPGNFVSQKFDTLPNEVQAKVSNYMGNKRKPEEKKSPPEIKSIKVPIPTFPPTAMVYSVPKVQPSQSRDEQESESPVDIVSAAIMAKVLEERERERSCIKHCDTCTCSNQIKIIHHISHHSISTQTHNNGTNDDSLCLQCNNKLDRSTITVIKGVSSVDECKNKSMPVYIHDYNEPNPNVANIAKVQPNNFLNDNRSHHDCSKLRKESVNSWNKLGSIRIMPEIVQAQTQQMLIATTLATVPIVMNGDDPVTDDLIDLGTPSSTCSNKASETIYFANEKIHKKSFKVKTHEDSVKTSSLGFNTSSNMMRVGMTKLITSQPHLQPPQTHHKLCQQQNNYGHNHTNLFQPLNINNILLDSGPTATNEAIKLQQVHLARNVVVPEIKSANLTKIDKPSSISSGDHDHSSEITFSEPTEPTSSVNNQRVEEWMTSNMTTKSTGGTDCSESLISLQSSNLHENKDGDVHEITDFKMTSSLESDRDVQARVERSDCENIGLQGRVSKAGLVVVNEPQLGIDTTAYKEMEDHVKKFLFGEYTILSEVKKAGGIDFH